MWSLRFYEPALDEWKGAVCEISLIQIGSASRHSLSSHPLRAALGSADAVPTDSAARAQLEHLVLLCEDSCNSLCMMLLAPQHPALMTNRYHYVMRNDILEQPSASMSCFSNPLQLE